MPLTPRERVLCALSHEEPDRVPLVIGAGNATGMKLKPYQGLKHALGIASPDRYIYDWPELGTVLPDESVLDALGSDVRCVMDRFPRAVYERNRSRPEHSPFLDDWGGGQVEVRPGVWYPGLHPLPDATTLEEIENFPWPEADDPTRYEEIRADAERLAAGGNYAVMGVPWLLFPFERAHELQGMDTFLTNMIAEPDFARALLRKIGDVCERIMGHFLEEAGDLIDIVKIGDDLGTQDSLLISPASYRDFLKPIHASLISLIKSKTGARIFFHSDGDVFDLIDDFIEIGVDILNPVQTSAGRMADLAALKKRFGKKITFCGAIDTQRVLPQGRPDEVRAEVARVIRLLGPGGGYLAAAVHTIMDEVPPENVLVMAEAVREYGRYPLNSD